MTRYHTILLERHDVADGQAVAGEVCGMVDIECLIQTLQTQEQAVIGSKEKQSRVVFVGVTALIEAENGICLLKSAEVLIVFPERLVVKCQNQSDTP